MSSPLRRCKNCGKVFRRITKRNPETYKFKGKKFCSWECYKKFVKEKNNPGGRHNKSNFCIICQRRHTTGKNLFCFTCKEKKSIQERITALKKFKQRKYDNRKKSLSQ